MSHNAGPRTTTPSAGARGTSGWVGWIAFASLMLILLGTFHVMEGIVALVKDEVFIVRPSGLIVNVDYTVWGWVHVVFGVVVFLAGIGVLAGQVWARMVGTVLAMLSAVVNLSFVAAYPVWSVTMLAVSVVVILALTVHGSEIKAG
ncbi:conserved membrane hypothetical protein [metagenome]|uniref:DUF7144 domain-containing protein n=1 Tax=metagenome TaxID=256318 RepID=A0A2P2BWR8_9ZZZZ